MKWRIQAFKVLAGTDRPWSLPMAPPPMSAWPASRSACWSTERSPLRQPGAAAGDGADPRPKVLYRHPRSGRGKTWRSLAAAGRRVGYAGREAVNFAGLERRYAEEPSGGSGDHAGARLRARQSSAGQYSTRNTAVYRDPVAILIDQLKEISIDGGLESVETANWVPKVIRKDFRIGLNVLGTAVDDPDVYFYQNYVCSSARNYPRLLRQGIRQDGRPGVDGSRSGEAQKDSAGRRL